VVICLFGSVAAAWPVAAQMQSTTQPARTTEANPPRIEVVRVKLIDPTPTPRFQLRDGVVDLTKAFSLGGSEGIGAIWKLTPAGETFDARFGRW
jgi:hypothetical protein